MKITINESEFCHEFKKIRPDNFSYEGLQALFEYLEQYEEDIGEELEFDPIAICCDFTEYENIKELQEDYPDIETIEELERNTTVIPVHENPEENGFIIQQF